MVRLTEDKKMTKHIKGMKAYRLEDKSNELEIAFAEAWEDENNDYDFFGRLVSGRPNGYDYETTDRDEEIAATVIQWLGSDAGQGFIDRVRLKAKIKARFK